MMEDDWFSLYVPNFIKVPICIAMFVFVPKRWWPNCMWVMR